ncbi:septation protein A [Psychrobium sp. 1_MG-2023]|uniref:septation protein A n=1 Tax=Psychrobium sp. 1_MG-2023 TaxID=3062624 RepID=UPI000C3232A0|nr:septation protein A [Psychrobium sp. 1_MG-2023]MDP2560230.1 septation protein A [Psychrobium sp. 1_MG-2023]PKF57040.1 septation protein A [Alteromonadales bacterium alter-6D02]
MKQLLDFLPLLAFFITYYLIDVYAATGALIAATVIQLALLQIIFKKIERSHWITFAVVSVFGALTLYLHDDAFIKWKVSIIYGIFAVVLLAYQVMSDPIPKKLLGTEIDAPDSVWRNITLGWALTCIVSAIANYYIAFNLSLDTWVNFKVFGLTALTFVLFIVTGIYLYKYMPEDEETSEQEKK